MKTYQDTVLSFVVLLLLTLIVPQGLFAETANEYTVTPRSQEIMAQAPKTPEELLLVIKGFLANPDQDGYEFFEKQFGFDRTCWGIDLPRGYAEGKGLLISRINTLPLPYHFDEVFLDRQYEVYKLFLSFYRNPDFRMTPAVTREILGSPTKIFVSSPRYDYSTGAYRVAYLYETERCNLHVTFLNSDEENNTETKRTHRYHTAEQIQNEQARRKSFEVHKDYLPLVMELSRHPRPRF